MSLLTVKTVHPSGDNPFETLVEDAYPIATLEVSDDLVPADWEAILPAPLEALDELPDYVRQMLPTACASNILYHRGDRQPDIRAPRAERRGWAIRRRDLARTLQGTFDDLADEVATWVATREEQP